MPRSTRKAWGLPVGQARRPVTQVRRGRARRLAAMPFALVPTEAKRFAPDVWWRWAATGHWMPPIEDIVRQAMGHTAPRVPFTGREAKRLTYLEHHVRHWAKDWGRRRFRIAWDLAATAARTVVVAARPGRPPQVLNLYTPMTPQEIARCARQLVAGGVR